MAVRRHRVRPFTARHRVAAQFFGQMGMDSVRMMETFVGASAMGQYAIDKVGDSVKEFSIRATDGSKSSSDAFKVLGLDATKMARDITAGGDVGAAAFQKTVDRLLAIKDPAKQAQTAIKATPSGRMERAKPYPKQTKTSTRASAASTTRSP